MTSINRVQVKWEQAGGFTGLNTFYQTGDVDLANYRALYVAFQASLPDDVTISFLDANLTYESDTGEVLSSYTTDPATDIAGTSSGDFARGVGVLLRWNTDAFRNNRRVRGRTYVVPVEVASFNTLGNVDAGFISGAVTAGNDFIAAQAAQNFIWHHPVNDVGGVINAVTSCGMSATPAILRSRRL